MNTENVGKYWIVEVCNRTLATRCLFNSKRKAQAAYRKLQRAKLDGSKNDRMVEIHHDAGVNFVEVAYETVNIGICDVQAWKSFEAEAGTP